MHMQEFQGEARSIGGASPNLFDVAVTKDEMNVAIEDLVPQKGTSVLPPITHHIQLWMLENIQFPLMFVR